jgi:hypothetical protein
VASVRPSASAVAGGSTAGMAISMGRATWAHGLA